jgi:hypothetical protein
MLFGFESPQHQAALFIASALKHHRAQTEKFNLAKTLLQSAEPFSFCIGLMKNIAFQKKQPDNVFTQTEDDILARTVIDRAVSSSGRVAIWDHLPDETAYLLYRWSALDLSGLRQYVDEQMKKDPQTVFKLLRTLRPTVRSASYPKLYKGDSQIEQYQLLDSVAGRENVIAVLNEKYGITALASDQDVLWNRSEDQLDPDLYVARQFMYFDRFVQSSEAAPAQDE